MLMKIISRGAGSLSLAPDETSRLQEQTREQEQPRELGPTRKLNAMSVRCEPFVRVLLACPFR